MAGEEARFQSAGLQVPLPSYAGVPTQTRPIQAADYSPMLRAIEEAGNNIMNSPLNPEVYQRMKTSIASSEAGQDTIAYQRAMGWLPWTTQVTGGQATVLGRGQLPQYAITMMPGPGMKGDNNNNKPEPPAPQPPAPAKTDTGYVDQHGKPVQPQPSTDNQPQTNNPPGNDFNVGRIVPDNTSAGSATNLPSLAANQPVAGAVAGAEYGANAANALDPSGVGRYFMASTRGAQGGAPAAPGGTAVAQATVPATDAQGNVNPALSASTNNDFLLQQHAQEQANLQQWQNNNQGSVMSAVAAKQWAQSNLDTDINRAVYLPAGGPKGPNGQAEPAYAFYGKHGGTNIVPISQMVKAGAGPLVAAQNFSHTLSAADQNQGQQPGLPQHIPFAPGQGPGQQPQQQPVQQPGMGPSGSPTPVSAQLGGPPAAPTTAPPAVSNVAGTPLNVPRQADGSVDWSRLPGQLSNFDFAHAVAAGTTASGGAPLNQFQASSEGTGGSGDAFVQSETRSPTLPNGVSRDMIEQARRDYAAGNKEPGVPNPLSRDPAHPDQFFRKFGDFPWYIDSATGIPYTRTTAENLWQDKRLYEGGTWTNVDVPRGLINQKIVEYDPRQADKVENMTDEEAHQALEDAWYRTKVLPTEQARRMPDDVRFNLGGLNNELLPARRILNTIKSIPDFNETDLERNRQIRNAETTSPSWKGTTAILGHLKHLGGVLQSGMEHSDPRYNFILDQQDELREAARQHGDNVDQILAGGGGGNYEDKLANWYYHQGNEFQKGVSAADTAQFHIPGNYLDTSHAIKNGTPLYDPEDKYVDKKTGTIQYSGPGSKQPMGKNQQEEINYNATHAANPNPTPTPAPTPAPGANPKAAATPFRAPGNTPPADGPGSLKQPIQVQNKQHYQSLHNVIIRDGNGDLWYRDNNGKVRAVTNGRY